MKKIFKKVRESLKKIFWIPEDLINLDDLPKGEKIFAEENINPALEPIRSFMEEFIGIPIIEFSTFDESIQDLHENISAKFITKTEIIEEDIWLELYDINGKNGGYLKLTPSLSGEFVEMDLDSNVIPTTMYRLIFYGEDVIDYVDVKKAGKLAFEERLK